MKTIHTSVTRALALAAISVTACGVALAGGAQNPNVAEPYSVQKLVSDVPARPR